MSLVEQNWRRRMVARDEATMALLRPLFTDPDAFFADPEVCWIKRGSSQSVIRLQLGGKPVLVKRYNLRDLGARARRAVTPSRAVRSWRAAQRLLEIGLNTPAPWGIMEERFGPLRGRALLVTDFCPGTPIIRSYTEGGAQTREAMEHAIQRFFALLRRHRISHRDTKDSNFLWHDGRLWALDLDSVRYHLSDFGADLGSRRDRRIFLRSWRHHLEAHRRLADIVAHAIEPG